MSYHGVHSRDEHLQLFELLSVVPIHHCALTIRYNFMFEQSVSIRDVSHACLLCALAVH
jgi:hypothetical protein